MNLQSKTMNRPCPNVRFFPFSDGGVLFPEGTGRIWVLNRTAAAIWCLQDEADTLEELTARVAENFQVENATAKRDAKAAVAFFEHEGLIGRDPLRSRETESEGMGVDLSPRGPVIDQPGPSHKRRFFRVSGHVLEICCREAASESIFSDLMAHMECGPVPGPDSRIWVVAGRDQGAWDMALNSRVFFENLAPEEILPHLFLLTFSLSSRALEEKFLFHAAVLARGEKAIIFPAEAGSGKTTLAAMLVKNGCSFVSDELAVLDTETAEVLPYPMPMSIKPESMPILAALYPELESAPVFPRPDGKYVRYLMPPKDRIAGLKAAFSLAGIVFPKYGPDKKTQLRAIEKPEALNRLAKTGSSDRPLTAEDVRAMITLVDHNPCFALDFSDGPEAVALLEPLNPEH